MLILYKQGQLMQIRTRFSMRASDDYCTCQ